VSSHRSQSSVSGAWPAGSTGRFTGAPLHVDFAGEMIRNKSLGPRSGPLKSAAARRGGPVNDLGLMFSVVVLLLISVTLRHDDSGDTFDSQVAVRLLGYSLAGLSVLFAIARRKLRLNAGMLAWAMVPIFIAATAYFAPQPLFALTAGIGHLVLLLFAWRMVNAYGMSRAAYTIVLTGMIIAVMSIFVFFVMPDLGRSTSDVLSGDPGGRMRGVTGQPNSLGFICAFTILVAVMQLRVFSARQRRVAYVAIAVAAICMIASESRTSIAALVISLLLWRLYRANAAVNLFAVIGLGLLGCVLVAFVPNIAIYLARNSAGPADLASLNGRSRIWAVAWENIQSHAFFGQGYGASTTILPTDDRLFLAAVNSHNVYLELLFSGGAILFALYAASVLVTVSRGARRQRGEALIALLFFLMVGATEATPFAGLPLFPAFAFYAAISMCLVRMPVGLPAVYGASLQTPPGARSPITASRPQPKWLRQPRQT
jgi:exopolysaccharide production protein ExoQ